MYYIKGFRGNWKLVSKEQASEYGKNRLKNLGLSVNNIPKQNDLKTSVINRHVKGIDLKEIGIYE